MTDGQSASTISVVPATRPRRQPAAIRRQQILDAAQWVMLRDGLHEATIADIADAADLGKGTIYLQFESKQELVAGLRHRYVERIEAEVVAHVAAAAGAADKLGAFVNSLIVASTRDPELHHLLFQETGTDEAEAFAPLRAVFAEIVQHRSGGADKTGLVADFALGGIHAGAIAVAHLPKTRRRTAIAEIVELTRRTVGV
jgi:AcrR family transcriptional regulator